MAAIPSTVEASQELLISELPEQSSLGQDAWRRLRRNRLAVVGLVIIAIFFVTALISIVWTPYPTWRQALGTTDAGPSLLHPLGLDDYGRDILSRVMGGAGIALAVGVGASFLASLTGIILGMLAGFFKGKVDALISLIINIFYGVPDLLVALILVVLIGRGLFNILLAIALTGWLGMARLVRGRSVRIRDRDYVEAARATGTPSAMLLCRRRLPHSLR